MKRLAVTMFRIWISTCVYSHCVVCRCLNHSESGYFDKMYYYYPQRRVAFKIRKRFSWEVIDLWTCLINGRSCTPDRHVPAGSADAGAYKGPAAFSPSVLLWRGYKNKQDNTHTHIQYIYIYLGRLPPPSSGTDDDQKPRRCCGLLKLRVLHHPPLGRLRSRTFGCFLAVADSDVINARAGALYYTTAAQNVIIFFFFGSRL